MRVLEVLDALHPRPPRGHRRRLHRLLLRAVGGELGRRVDRPRRALRLDDGACLLRGAAAADGEANLLTRARRRDAVADVLQRHQGPPGAPPGAGSIARAGPMPESPPIRGFMPAFAPAGAGPPFVPPPGIAADCWRSAACCLTSSCVACACSCWGGGWGPGRAGGGAPRGRAGA